MPLSISKLIELLQEKGFIASKFFVMDGYCFYIELFAINTADIFLLYIPSKYSFAMKEDQNSHSTYKIKYIQIDTSILTDEYKKANLQDIYENAKIHLSPDNKDLENHMENNYKKAISLPDITESDFLCVASIVKQLNRLKFCVEDVNYKIGILYKNYLCAIRRDNTIDAMYIKHFPRIESKKLYIVVDLETFYQKNEEILENITSVRNGVYKILEKNWGNHTTIMRKMIENKRDIIMIPQKAQEKKQQYEMLINRLEKALKIIQKIYSDLRESFIRFDTQKTDGISNDVQNTYKKDQIKKEMEKLHELQTDASKNILYLRDKREDAIIDIDKIMFDNTIMFDQMIKNFALLKKFA